MESNAFVVDTVSGAFPFTDASDPLDGTATGVFSAGIGVNATDISGDWAPIGEEIAGYGFTWTYTITPAVPEPTSAGFLLLGLAGLVAQRRRS